MSEAWVWIAANKLVTAQLSQLAGEARCSLCHSKNASTLHCLVLTPPLHSSLNAIHHILSSSEPREKQCHVLI